MFGLRFWCWRYSADFGCLRLALLSAISRLSAPESHDSQMSSKSFILVHDIARERALQAVKTAPEGYCVTIDEPTRTKEQNSLLWPLLQEIAAQVDWHGSKLTDEEWKDMFTATLYGQKSVPNLDKTGFIILGRRTSKMSKKDFSELLDLIAAFAAEHGVQFKEAA